MKHYISQSDIKVSCRYAGRVTAAVFRANQLLNDTAFLAAIKQKTDWTHLDSKDVDAVGPLIMSQLKSSTTPCPIVSYRSSWWRRRVVAKVIGRRPPIYLNTRYFGRSANKIAGTIVHEYMHVLGWGHGSNKRRGKGNSVPYWIGSLAANWKV